MKGRALDEYEAHVGGLLSHVWRREGENIVCDPAEMNTPLTELLDAESAASVGADLDYLPGDLKELRFQTREKLVAMILRLLQDLAESRLQVQTALFEYFFGNGPAPVQVLERLFIYARATYGDCVWKMKQHEMAALFGHSKQNWQHMEERLIEDLVSRYSRTEFVNAGGKSVGARQKYAEQRKGNTSRKRGRRAGDELPPLPPKERDDQPLSERAKRHAELMRHEAERKRLARMCRCAPEDIDLGRITPLE